MGMTLNDANASDASVKLSMKESSSGLELVTVSEKTMGSVGAKVHVRDTLASSDMTVGISTTTMRSFNTAVFTTSGM